MENTKDAEINQLVTALGLLIEAKEHKDTIGKDDWYEINQPIAWENARRVIYGYCATPQPVSPVATYSKEIHQVWDLVNGYTGDSICRDCADSKVNGICDYDNEPCNPQKRCIERIKRLQQKSPEWIKASERLPEYQKTVFVKYITNSYHTAELYDESKVGDEDAKNCFQLSGLSFLLWEDEFNNIEWLDESIK